MSKNPPPVLISCGILRREIQKLVSNGSLAVKPVFLDAGLHVDYTKLEKVLTGALDTWSKESSNKIVVVYGDLCHPRIKRMIGKYRNVVKVEALNCIDCLLGGHERLYQLDPNGDHFYLSPGWMPSNLRANIYFREIFDWSQENIKEMFKDLTGIIVVDSLENPDEFKADIEEFSLNSGLPVKQTKTVGVNELKTLVLEAIKKLSIN